MEYVADVLLVSVGYPTLYGKANPASIVLFFIWSKADMFCA